MNAERKTIFLVDDDMTNLAIGKKNLSASYNVFTLNSGAVLLQMLEKKIPDLILLDVDMPKMNGYETIKILKSKPNTQNIPVIFLTARTESGDELEGLSLGAIDYITKPFQLALLLKRIEVHLLVQDQRKTLEYFYENLRKAFSTYLSGDVVEEIIADPTRLQLGGINRRMSVMFTDVEGFTSISDRLNPSELVSLLNQYLSTMSDVIMEKKGTIDKYVGDAIIAFFGAPLELPDHALRACTSAVTMKRLEKVLNRSFIDQGISTKPIYTRIGINTGEMVVGNMGTERKMNYTVMGNAVNIAARLEPINKQYGTKILVSEHTIQEAKGHFLSRRLDRIKVTGTSEPLRIHEVLETSADAPASLHEQVALFHKALDIFESRNWQDAEKAFNHIAEVFPSDAPSILYRDRCRQYMQNPPHKNWDGVFNLMKK
ncbi:MAG: response regulator [Spirochaetes bacterium]|nr:response regulator [Spirochaetota bacterium]